MKNLHALLFAAAFASMMPSTATLCSEEVIACSEESTEIEPVVIPVSETTNTPETVNTTQKIKSAINTATHTITKNKNLLISLTANVGVWGLLAGAQGSHSLKKIKRVLVQSNNGFVFTQLNKGIKNNRIMMATSLAAVSISAALIADEQSTEFRKLPLKNN